MRFLCCGLIALLGGSVPAWSQTPAPVLSRAWSTSLREVAPVGERVDALLIAGLRSADPEVRRKAAVAIGAKDLAMDGRWEREGEERIRSRRVLIDVLIEVTKTSDPVLYRQSVRTLAILVRNRVWGHHGEPWSDLAEVAPLVKLAPKAIPVLTELMLESGTDYAVNVGICRALRETRDPRTIPALIDLAKRSDHFLLSESLDTLAIYDDPRVIPALIENIDKNILSYEDTPSIWALRKVGKKAAPDLVEAISHHPRNSGRYYAAHALVHIVDPRAIPGLQRALDDPIAEIRREAINALAVQEVGKVPSRPIRYCLLDPDARVRAAACAAVGVLGDKSAFEVIRRRLKDTDPEVRARAIQTLVKLNGLKALPVVGMLRDDEKVQHILADALGKIPGPNSEDHLIWLLEYGAPNARIQAIRTLGERKSVRAVPHLIKSLLTNDQNIYGHEEALSSIGAPAATALLEAYPRAYFSARSAIVGALGATRDRRALPILSSLVKHRDLDAKAIESLGYLGDPTAISLIRPLIDSPDNSVKREAILALGRLKDRKSFPALLLLLQDDYWTNYAGMSLGFLGDPRALEPMLAVLQREKFEGRWQIVDALGYFRDPRLVPFLIKELNHPSCGMGAAMALGRIGDPAALPALRRVAESDDHRFKNDALEAIATIERGRGKN